MSDSATTPHLPTGSTRTIMIVVLLVCNVLACFLEMLMNIALDHIATQYDIRLSLANWVVLGFAIVNATAITTAASLLRRFGIRKIMLTGCLFALAGSLLGFFATSFPLIVVARLIQAVTTGLFFPVVNEALFTLSPKGKAGILLSANSAVCGFAFALTPPIAGLVLTYGGLKALFLVPAACALVLGVVCYFTLHNIYARVKRKIDIPSLVLSFVGLGAFMCGLNEVAHDPLPSIVLMLFGAVMIAVFVRRQLRIPTPLLDLRPFKYQVFSLGETLIMIAYMGSLFVSLVVPLYLEGVQGETPFIAGCLLSIPICTYATLCIVSGKVLSKRGIWPLVSCGFGLAVLGFILVYGGVSLGNIVLVLVFTALAYGGIGLAYPSVKSVDFEAVPQRCPHMPPQSTQRSFRSQAQSVRRFLWESCRGRWSNLALRAHQGRPPMHLVSRSRLASSSASSRQDSCSRSGIHVSSGRRSTSARAIRKSS